MALAEKFSEIQPNGQAFDPIRKITVVGGLRGCCYGGDDPDSADLTRVVDLLRRNRIVRDTAAGQPDIDIRVMNLEWGEDFLKTPPASDLVFISYLPDITHANQMRHVDVTDPAFDFKAITEEETLKHPHIKHQFDYVVSDCNHETQWVDALQRTDAKMVISCGGFDELGAKDLDGLGFQVFDHQSSHDYIDDPQRFLTSKVGLPHQFFSVLVKPDYTRHVLEHCGDLDTLFVERARVLDKNRTLLESKNVFDKIQGWARSVYFY